MTQSTNVITMHSEAADCVVCTSYSNSTGIFVVDTWEAAATACTNLLDASILALVSHIFYYFIYTVLPCLF